MDDIKKHFHCRCEKDEEIMDIHKQITKLVTSDAKQAVILNRLDHAINGNGREGMVTRYNRLEGQFKALWILVTLFVTGFLTYLFAL